MLLVGSHAENLVSWFENTSLIHEYGSGAGENTQFW